MARHTVSPRLQSMREEVSVECHVISIDNDADNTESDVSTVSM